MAFAPALERGADALDAQSGDPGGEVCAVDPIAVVDQIAGVLAPQRGLDHLAPEPGGGRVGGHVGVEQAAAVVADQEEDVEGQERIWTTKRSATQMASARLARNVRQLWLGGGAGSRRRQRRMERALMADAELEELAADPLGASVRVLARHGGDQLADLEVQAQPAQSAAEPPAP